MQKLTGFVDGPKDTAYEGGYFVVDIVLGGLSNKIYQAPVANQHNAQVTADNQYPFVPPNMRFVTKVWHPNVSSANGAICLDILKDQWSPALTLKTALLSLQALLSSPEPADPQVLTPTGSFHKQYNTEHGLIHALLTTLPVRKATSMQCSTKHLHVIDASACSTPTTKWHAGKRLSIMFAAGCCSGKAIHAAKPRISAASKGVDADLCSQAKPH